MACHVKDLALSLLCHLQCGFNPWPGNFCMPWEWQKKKIKKWLGSICWYKMIKCPSFSGTEGVLRKLIFTTNVWLNNKLLKCFCLKKKKKLGGPWKWMRVIILLSKPTEYRQPIVNHGLEVILMCQCMFNQWKQV